MVLGRGYIFVVCLIRHRDNFALPRNNTFILSIFNFSHKASQSVIAKTNCMDEGPSWEADSHTASQEIHCIMILEGS